MSWRSEYNRDSDNLGLKWLKHSLASTNTRHKISAINSIDILSYTAPFSASTWYTPCTSVRCQHLAPKSTVRRRMYLFNKFNMLW